MGKILLQFCKEVKVESVVQMEMMAFKEGLLVTAASPWASSYSFVF